MGFVCILIHTCWSLITLRPEIHAKFFDEKGALSCQRRMVFLLRHHRHAPSDLASHNSIPVIAHSMDAKQWKAIPESGLIALLFGPEHLVFIYGGWYPAEKWRAPLPHTTLVAASGARRVGQSVVAVPLVTGGTRLRNEGLWRRRLQFFGFVPDQLKRGGDAMTYHLRTVFLTVAACAVILLGALFVNPGSSQAAKGISGRRPSRAVATRCLPGGGRRTHISFCSTRTPAAPGACCCRRESGRISKRHRASPGHR